jgi:hypothetical protein
MRLYYLIWVDLILKAKSQPANKHNWQVMTLIFMTVPMAVDFLFFMMILQRGILNFYFYEFQIPLIPQMIADPLSLAILYLGPPLVVNYVLIFRNRRYEKLIKKYKSYNGKLAATTIILALFVPNVALWLGIIYDII